MTPDTALILFCIEFPLGVMFSGFGFQTLYFIDYEQLRMGCVRAKGKFAFGVLLEVCTVATLCHIIYLVGRVSGIA